MAGYAAMAACAYGCGGSAAVLRRRRAYSAGGLSDTQMAAASLAIWWGDAPTTMECWMRGVCFARSQARTGTPAERRAW
eukprot:9503703-Pyramimonas_sp.AAC.2